MPLIRKPTDTAAASVAPDMDAAKADLRSPESDLRWKAARTLGAFPSAAAILGEAALTEADPRVREAIFTSLARIGSVESVALLVPHVRADDAERRTGAMDALKSMPGVLAGRPAGPAPLWPAPRRPVSGLRHQDRLRPHWGTGPRPWLSSIQ
jgi:hypothetical protein